MSDKNLKIEVIKLEMDLHIALATIENMKSDYSAEKIRRLELEIKLEEASQEIASLQQCDCIERGAE